MSGGRRASRKKHLISNPWWWWVFRTFCLAQSLRLSDYHTFVILRWTNVWIFLITLMNSIDRYVHLQWFPRLPALHLSPQTRFFHVCPSRIPLTFKCLRKLLHFLVCVAPFSYRDFSSHPFCLLLGACPHAHSNTDVCPTMCGLVPCVPYTFTVHHHQHTCHIWGSCQLPPDCHVKRWRTPGQ